MLAHVTITQIAPIAMEHRNLGLWIEVVVVCDLACTC